MLEKLLDCDQFIFREFRRCGWAVSELESSVPVFAANIPDPALRENGLAFDLD